MIDFINLDDLPVEIIDGDRGDNYPPKSEFKKGGYCIFLNTGNITPLGFDFSEIDFISIERDNLLRNGKLIKNDIILTTRGTVGNVAFYNDDVPYKNLRINSGMVIIRPDIKKIDPYYLFTFFNSDLFKKQVKDRGSGSAQPQLPIQSLNKIKIPNKNIDQQIKISNFIKPIDKSIFLNEDQNFNFINLIQFIFNYWFVQFDFPNENNKPYKSSGGKMLWSKIFKREIPQNWSDGVLKDVLSEIECGDRPKGGIQDISKGIPSIGAENIIKIGKYFFNQEKLIPVEFFKKMKNGIVKSSDVLMYKDGANLGRISMFKNNFPHSTCAINSHVFILRSNLKISQIFLYFWLEQSYIKKLIKIYGIKAAQPGINQTDVSKIPILIPDKKIINKFNSKINCFVETIFNNSNKIKKLNEIKKKITPFLIAEKVY
jgi:type I restriction enzyme S subunit